MYILTGGAGFIGSVMLQKLNQEGISNVLVVDNLGQSDKWKNLLGKSYLDFVHKSKFLDLLYDNKLGNSIKGIIHLGACSATTEKNADYLIDNNFHYTWRLAEWALSRQVRFIYASSAATYGDGVFGYSDDHAQTHKYRPLNMYGYSKHLFDLWAIRTGNLDRMVGLKFFNVYGPNEYHKADMRSVIHKAYYQIKQAGQVSLFKSYRPEYGDGDQVRDFIYVNDCVDIIWWLMNNPQVNGLYNLGTGKARSWNDLVRAIFSALSIEPNIKYIEMPESLRNQYQYHTEADMKKLQAAKCPIKARSIEDGVRDYVVNYLEKELQYL